MEKKTQKIIHIILMLIVLAVMLTGTIAVTPISSSSTQTIFNIKFNGVINQSGFTMTQNYDITYTYTKK